MNAGNLIGTQRGVEYSDVGKGSFEGLMVVFGLGTSAPGSQNDRCAPPRAEKCPRLIATEPAGQAGPWSIDGICAHLTWNRAICAHRYHEPRLARFTLRHLPLSPHTNSRGTPTSHALRKCDNGPPATGTKHCTACISRSNGNRPTAFGTRIYAGGGRKVETWKIDGGPTRRTPEAGPTGADLESIEAEGGS